MKVNYFNKKIFWKNGDNFPSYSYFNNTFLLDYKTGDFKVNYNNNIDNVDIILNKDEDISYIWFEYNNWVWYYYLESFNLLANNSKILHFKLDKFATYFLYFFDKIKDISFLFVRTPIKSENMYMFNDPLLDNLIMDGTYQFLKYNFSSQVLGDKKYWEYDNARISYDTNTNDIVNGCMYYVFNSDPEGIINGKYVFLPILSEKSKCYYETKGEVLDSIDYKIYPPEASGTYYAQDLIYWNTKTNQQENFDSVINNYNLAFNSNYNITFYNKNNGLLNSRNFTLEEFKNLFCYKSYRISRGSVVSTRIYTYTYGIKNSRDTISLTNYEESVRGGNYLSNENYITLHIPLKGNASWTGKEISNSYENLNNFKFSKEWSNKFLGAYFLPHCLFLQNLAKIYNINYTPLNSAQISKPFLGYVLQPEGNNIINFKIFDDALTNNNNNNIQYNCSELNNDYLYKILKAKYYNNEIDLSLFYKNNFVINGYLNFNGVCNIIYKLNNFRIIDCIWSLPYQLPSGTDLYNNYINATYNSVNTSYSIAKQNAIWNGYISANKVMGNILAANAFDISKNPVGPIMSATNAIGNIGNIGNSILSVKQTEQKIRATYADAKNKYGSEIKTSLSEDTAWINYYLKDKEQYSGIEIFIPSDYSTILANNILYFYNYYAPNVSSFNKLKEAGIDNYECYFIALDENDLIPKLDILINKYLSNFVPSKDYGYISNLLISGIRFWNKDPSEILINCISKKYE